MDEVRNPFAPDAGTPPPEMAGRDGVMNEADVAIARTIKGRASRSLMLIGLRGTGKTVLLVEIESRAEAAGMVTFFIESPENQPFARQFAVAAKKALMKFSAVEAAKSHARAGLGALASFISSVKLAVGEVSVAVDPTPGEADSGDLSLDMIDLMIRVGRAAKAAGRGWTIVVDEVQHLDAQSLSALIVALHRANQLGLPIFFAGAGLPLLPKLLGEARSYSERIFSYHEIAGLEEDASRQAIEVPIEAEGQAIEAEALALIHQRTAGYPFFLQEWAYHAWNVSDGSPIGLGDIEAATELAVARLDRGFFRVRTNQMTRRELEICQVMASMGPGPYGISTLAENLDVKLTSLSLHRSNLIRKGMIYPTGMGEIDFTVPMFDGHLRRIATTNGDG